MHPCMQRRVAVYMYTYLAMGQSFTISPNGEKAIIYIGGLAGTVFQPEVPILGMSSDFSKLGNPALPLLPLALYFPIQQQSTCREF